MMVRMPNGDLIAQTDAETDICPKGYVRDCTDPRRFHPIHVKLFDQSKCNWFIKKCCSKGKCLNLNRISSECQPINCEFREPQNQNILFTKTSRQLLEVRDWSIKYGEMEEGFAAICRWEEHGRLFYTRRIREQDSWCHEHLMVPMYIDKGYLDHGNTFILEYRDLEDKELIDKDWSQVSGILDWSKQDSRIKKYVKTFQENLAKAERTINEPYVVLWAQWGTNLSRIKGTWDELISQIKIPYRLIVKVGPAGISRLKYSDIIYHDRRQPLQNHSLMKFAEYNIIVNSTVSNELILGNTKVFAIGKERFNGKGVFTEISSFEELDPSKLTINQEARNKYLNWWLQNQCYENQLSNRISYLLARARKEWKSAYNARRLHPLSS